MIINDILFMVNDFSPTKVIYFVDISCKFKNDSYFCRQNNPKTQHKMKKSIFLIAAMLLMGSSAFAGGGFDFSIGPKIGYQTAKLSYKQSDIQSGFANHFTIGAFGRFEVGGFYLQPEVLWFKTSNAFTLNTNVQQDVLIGDITIPSGASVDFTLNSMNIQVPVLLGYKFNIVNNLIAIRAQVGPTMNFTIPQTTLVNQAIGSSEPTEISNETFDTKTIAFGLQGGVGLDVLKRITLDINYNLGITKMFDTDVINPDWGQYIDTNNISDAHTNMFMVTIGYRFL